RAWFERREAARLRLAASLEQRVQGRDLAEAGLPVAAGSDRRSLSEWLRHGSITMPDLAPWLAEDIDLEGELAAEIAEDALYAPYLLRQEAELRDLRAGEELPLGDDFPFAEIAGLS